MSRKTIYLKHRQFPPSFEVTSSKNWWAKMLTFSLRSTLHAGRLLQFRFTCRNRLYEFGSGKKRAGAKMEASPELLFRTVKHVIAKISPNVGTFSKHCKELSLGVLFAWQKNSGHCHFLMTRIVKKVQKTEILGSL